MNKKIFLLIILAFLSLNFKSFAGELMPPTPKPAVNFKVEAKTVVPEKKIVKENLKTVSKVEKQVSQVKRSQEIKNITGDIKDELNEEQEKTLSDLMILWQSAVEKSDTIRFAILKLSNPEGEVEKKSVVKKILQPVAGLAPIFGANAASPVAGASSILGGGLLGSMLSDDSFLINKSLSRVSDADLVLLVQEIDNLQQKLVNLYYGYKNSVEKLAMADKIVQNRYRHYELSQKSTDATVAVADVFYREALDMQYKARQEVLNSRLSLEQLVGNDAIVEIEKNQVDKAAAIIEKKVN